MAFRSSHRYWKFKPQDGLAVLARGRIDVYEARGEYQLLVEVLEPQGLGALQLAFEQLKKKLAAEGLFDAARKRPLPRFPRRIGIVTSPRGAAIADMIHILTRRFPGLHIRLYPALVQGEGSVEEVCRGIEYFSRAKWADVVIVGARRRVARRSVDVQRRGRGAGHRGVLRAGDFGGGARNRRDHRRFRGRPARAHALGGRRVGHSHAAGSCWSASLPRAPSVVQAQRYRLAMLERRLRQRASNGPPAPCGCALGRAQQRIDDLSYRMRERGARRYCGPGARTARRSKRGWRVSICARAWRLAAADWKPRARRPSASFACAWRARRGALEQLAARAR